MLDPLVMAECIIINKEGARKVWKGVETQQNAILKHIQFLYWFIFLKGISVESLFAI